MEQSMNIEYHPGPAISYSLNIVGNDHELHFDRTEGKEADVYVTGDPAKVRLRIVHLIAQLQELEGKLRTQSE